VRNYEDGKILEIDVNNMDFASNPDDFNHIVSLLNKELFYV
jgi:deoxyadenosine/deoxycytidine kinase